MSKERYNQIIEEVYENYKTVHKHAIRTEGNRNKLAMESLEKQLIYTQEEFIDKCKADNNFSERWGLIIEERELSLDERHELLNKATDRNHKRENCFSDEEFERETLQDCKAFNIPTKLITTTYNDKTIKNYE
jgi:PHD/YefM family antitoxin component YafN of YafNO toxin-antitoxin module